MISNSPRKQSSNNLPPPQASPSFGRYPEIPYDRMTPQQQEGYPEKESRGAGRIPLPITNSPLRRRMP
jgi:hypothetical protein